MIIIQSTDNLLRKLAKKVIYFDFLFPVITKCLFELAYINQFSYLYSYMGSYYNPNMTKMWLSWIPIILFSVLRKFLKDDKLSSFFNFLLCLSAIPSFSIYWLKNENTQAFFLIVIYWFMWWLSTLVISLICKSYGFKKVNELCFTPKSNNAIIIYMFFFALVTTIVFSALYGNFRFFVAFEDVYQYRLGTPSMGLLAYIFLFNTRVILPICLCIHIMQKNYLLSFIDILLFFMSYSIYGAKIILFSIPLVLGVIALQKLDLLKFTDSMVFLFIIVLLVITISMPQGHSMFIALVDRVLEGPAAGHYFYYDFFSNPSHPFLFLRESILRHFFPSPYNGLTTVIIGSSSIYFYTGNYNNFNNGLMSMAYANFGAIGVLLQPVFIVSSLFFNLKIMKNYNETIQYVVLLLHSFYLMSASYLQWLMSGGCLFMMLTLYIIEHNKFKFKLS